MLTITFQPWTFSGNFAIAHFQVTDNFGDGIAKVQARVYRQGAVPPPFSDAPSYTASADITQYQGILVVDVLATDLSGRSNQASNTVGATNYVPPIAPDYFSYDHLQRLGVIFTWGLTSAPASVATWRVVNTHRDGTTNVLAEVPVSQHSVPVVIDTQTLYSVTVYGVDAVGHVSGPSPVLVFASDQYGPIVQLSDLVFAGGKATANWVIGSREVVTGIDWQWRVTGTQRDAAGNRVPYAFELVGKGLPLGSSAIPVSSIQGVVTFTLTATDRQTRETTVTKQSPIYLIPPGAPAIKANGINLTSITISVTPDPLDPQPIDHVVVYGPGGQVNVQSPFSYTFTGLTPGSTYTFAAQSVNASGIAGPISSNITAQTFKSSVPPSVTVPPYQGGPLLPYLRPLLTDDLRHYILQLFTDARIRAPLATQQITPPNGFEAVLDYMKKVGPFFGQILRSEANDSATHAASLLIDKTPNPLEKLAIFCERLEFGFIWNQG